MKGDGYSIKALTLFQPWASLIAYGAPRTCSSERLYKTIETRNWRGRIARISGELAIHAGKTFDDMGAWAVEEYFGIDLDGVPMPKGAIVAVATVRGVAPLLPGHCRDALFPGSPEHGRFGIFLRNVRALPDPIHCRGAQGFWTLPPEVVDAVGRAVA